MNKPRRHFTGPEKVAILKRHLLEKTPVSNLCDELGITPTLFYRWQKDFFENGHTVFENDRKSKAVEDAKQRNRAFIKGAANRSTQRGSCVLAAVSGGPDSVVAAAESVRRRLTEFTIGAEGALHDRRIFADSLDGPPDGIALDAEGGVWTSMTLAHQFERIVAGGAVTDRIDMGERVAIACTLGGPERRTLFLLSSTDAYPQRLVGTRLSRLDVVTVGTPGAGLP